MTYWSIFYSVIYQVCEISQSDLNIFIKLIVLDLALIFWSAGLFKYRAGYLQGYGIEFGLVNPMWSRFTQFFKSFLTVKLAKVLNFLAVISELLISVLIVTGSKRALVAGCLLLILMFVSLLVIRLGMLTLTMIAIPTFIVFAARESEIAQESNSVLADQIESFIYIYAVLLVVSTIWNWLAFSSIRLTPTLRTTAAGITKFTGAIIWSVFTANITENQVSVEIFEREGLANSKNMRRSLRNNVHVNIMLANLAVFPSYFPHAKQELDERIRAIGNWIMYLENVKSIQIRVERICSQDGNWSIEIVKKYYLSKVGKLTLVTEKEFGNNAKTKYHLVKVSKKLGSYE